MIRCAIICSSLLYYTMSDGKTKLISFETINNICRWTGGTSRAVHFKHTQYTNKESYTKPSFSDINQKKYFFFILF